MAVYSPELLAQIKRKIEIEYRLSDRMSGFGFKHYLDRVIIDGRDKDDEPVPIRFASIAEPWQWDQALTMAPAIEAITRVADRRYYGPRSFWRGMSRGHDKTSSIARMCNWILAYTKRNLSGIVCAADREQAGLLTEFMENESRLNPWFKNHLEFKRDRVVGRHGSTLRVLAADAYGSFGMKPDFTICDELTHWADIGLWKTIASGSQKRPGAVMVVITNAGTQGTWQWDMRNLAKDSRFWSFFEAKGNMASWMMTPRALDMQRAYPEVDRLRLHENRWVDPAEEFGYVTRAEVQACADRGFNMGLAEKDSGEPDLEYFAGVDYGPKKDRTVCVVGHRKGDEFIVDRMDIWQGKNFKEQNGGTVPIEKVEEWIERVRLNYPKVTFVIDQYQMEGTIQKFAPVCRIERFEPRGGKANYEMAIILRDLIVNKRIHWYPGCGDLLACKSGEMTLSLHTLVDEFAELIIKPRAYGFRFDHMSGKHDDRAVALGMACWKAVGSLRRRPFQMRESFF